LQAFRDDSEPPLFPPSPLALRIRLVPTKTRRCFGSTKPFLPRPSWGGGFFELPKGIEPFFSAHKASPPPPPPPRSTEWNVFPFSLLFFSLFGAWRERPFSPFPYSSKLLPSPLFPFPPRFRIWPERSTFSLILQICGFPFSRERIRQQVLDSSFFLSCRGR